MTTSAAQNDPVADASGDDGPAPGGGLTKVSAVWVAVGVGLLCLVLLLVFVLQNLQRSQVHFLGLNESLPLGLALLVAATAGGVVVGVAGVARVVQLRHAAHR
ncbi:DUF1049 domain-containing protein [Angustibacter sp. McL0619]|uniref:DUF1049 domain-containing protein n=1 Tax=Angustibacter sp. McL0619 TaxID=3415676 RepID=UPI003CE6F1C8